LSVLLTLWRLLDHRQRRQLVGLQLLSIVMALSTVGGIAAVLPFFAALADANAIEHNALLRAVLQRVHLDDGGSFAAVLGMVFAAVVLIANAVNLFGFLAINRFAARVGDTLYVRLFDEYIHRDYEFHVRGGQRQRLAIARALYRDASLLILDEATSALDTAAEGEIAETLDLLRPNRTILVIAHRTQALRHCDLVFALSDGRVVGSGKYGQIVPVNARAAKIS